MVVARRHALGDGVDSGQHDQRLLAAFQARQARQRGQPLRQHAAMRRDAVVGLAVPGRELQHIDLGCEELQCTLQLRHARAVAADDGKADRPRASAWPRARAPDRRRPAPSAPSATLAMVTALRRAAAARPAISCLRGPLIGRLPRRESSASARTHRWHARRNAAGAGQCGIEVRIRQFDQLLEFGQLRIRQIGQMRVGKAPDDQIHLARAAMPAAEQKPLAPIVEPVARSCRSCHVKSRNNPQRQKPGRAGRGVI